MLSQIIKKEIMKIKTKKMKETVRIQIIQKEKTMKTNITRFALISCIIPFCSCGTDLALNSTDRGSALQTILIDQPPPRTVELIIQHTQEEKVWTKRIQTPHMISFKAHEKRRLDLRYPVALFLDLPLRM